MTSNGLGTGVRTGMPCKIIGPDGSEVKCKVYQIVGPVVKDGDPMFIVRTESGALDAVALEELRPL